MFSIWWQYQVFFAVGIWCMLRLVKKENVLSVSALTAMAKGTVADCTEVPVTLPGNCLPRAVGYHLLCCIQRISFTGGRFYKIESAWAAAFSPITGFVNRSWTCFNDFEIKIIKQCFIVIDCAAGICQASVTFSCAILARNHHFLIHGLCCCQGTAIIFFCWMVLTAAHNCSAVRTLFIIDPLCVNIIRCIV